MLESYKAQNQYHSDPPKKGNLKIFFGDAAGVGKTYALLEAAHQAQKRGIDIVVGYIDRHTRPDTLALLEGLEQLPEKKLNIRESPSRSWIWMPPYSAAPISCW